MSASILKATDLSKTFTTKQGDVRAVDSASFELNAGDFVAMHGPSGCGKSTLLLMAGALLSPDSGTVEIAGDNPYSLGPEPRAAFRGERIGFVFQQFHLIPYLDVLDNVLIGELAANDGENLNERAQQLLEQFQLSHRLHHTPSTLSVGEQQRVALARALLRSPKLVLADEPTGNLDTENSAIILEHLGGFAKDGGAVLMVTHDDRARAAANRAIELNEGKIVPAAS
ncbi:MAG: putative ABC transport system ATP-binding protein [Verrucomicrobiales bacterium]|jgi:putative ABC transport system ATP-binding protein